MIRRICNFLTIILLLTALGMSVFHAKFAAAVPNQSPGAGSGAIATDGAGNIAIGSSTVDSASRVVIVATSSSSGVNSLKIMPFSGATPLFMVRGDGNVGIGTASPSYTLTVNGTISGTSLIGTVPANNVTANTFAAGNFAFQNNLGVGYVSGAGLPQMLSVAGGGYFQNAVGVGNTNPGAGYMLDVTGDIHSTAYLRLGTTSNLHDHSGTYTSIDVGGSANGYAGINFTDVSGSGGRLMVHTTADIQGFYKEGVGWSWYFQGGALTAGTVPWARLTTFPAGCPAGQAVQSIGASLVCIAVGGGSSVTGGGTTNYISKWTGSTAIGNSLLYDNGTNVGVGNAAPGYKLDVTGSVRGTEMYTDNWFRNNTAGTGLYNQVLGNYWYAQDSNYWVERSNRGTIYQSIAGTTAGYVYYDGGSFGLLNNLGGWMLRNPYGTYDVYTNDNGGSLIVGNGTGKINVGTVDPIYTIGGKQYATYLPGMTGQKEETTGNVNLEVINGGWAKEMDFSDLPSGSDLWLFAKVTDLAHNFDNLTMLLTPAFDGKVWYEKDSANKKLIIHGDKSGVVSYRLSAPRFDAANWSNVSQEQSQQGFNLDKLLKP